MNKITHEIFKKLSVEKRYQLLKERGEHVAGRYWTDYNVHLYTLDGLFVEVWIKMGANQIYWIEIQKNKEILAEYANQVDISKLIRD
ncbi:MAG: hypothetical protein ACK4K0_00440 [Flavobacteriales bacterium]